MSETVVTPVFCDWVTAVSPATRHNSWLRRFLSTEETKQVHKAYHRERGVEYYPSAVRHYFSPHEVEQTSIMVMDGNCLSNMRTEHGNDWASKVVAILARSSDHLTRIDIAVDIMDGGLLANRIANDVLNGLLTFGRRKSVVIKGGGIGGGCTVYVGSRTSPKFLRIYDKFAESEGKIPATRIEFELKAEAAEGVGINLSIIEGWKEFPKMFTALLGEFHDWEDYPGIYALRFGEVTSIDIPPRERLLSRKEWLSKQVAPTFLKDMSGEGGELWQWFKELIESNR